MIHFKVRSLSILFEMSKNQTLNNRIVQEKMGMSMIGESLRVYFIL